MYKYIFSGGYLPCKSFFLSIFFPFPRRSVFDPRSLARSSTIQETTRQQLTTSLGGGRICAYRVRSPFLLVLIPLARSRTSLRALVALLTLHDRRHPPPCSALYFTVIEDVPCPCSTFYFTVEDDGWRAHVCMYTRASVQLRVGYFPPVSCLLFSPFFWRKGYTESLVTQAEPTRPSSLEKLHFPSVTTAPTYLRYYTLRVVRVPLSIRRFPSLLLTPLAVASTSYTLLFPKLLLRIFNSMKTILHSRRILLFRSTFP